MPTVPFAPTVDVATGGMVPLGAPTAEPFKSTADLLPTAIGEAGQKLGVALMSATQRKAIEDQRNAEIADEALVAKADNEYSKAVIAALYGDGGFMTLTGTNASQDRLNAVLGDLHSKQDQIRKGLPSEFSQKLYALHSQGRDNQIEQTTRGHYATQVRESFLSETIAQAQTDLSLAARTSAAWQNTKNPEGEVVLSAFNENLSAVQTNLRRGLLAAGKGEKDVTLILEKTMSGFHTDVVKSMIAEGREGTAQQYYEAHLPEILSPARTDLTNLLHGAASQKIVSDQAIEIESNVAGLDQQLRASKERYEQGEFPAKDYEAINSKLIHDHSVKEKIKAEGVVAVQIKLKQWVGANKGKGINDLPADLYRDASDNALLDDVTAYAAAVERGFDIHTKNSTWVSFYEDMLSPQTLAAMTPTSLAAKYGFKMSHDDLKHAESMLYQAKHQTQKEINFTSVYTVGEHLTQRARESAILPAQQGVTPTPEQTKQFAMLQHGIQQVLTARETQAGRKLTTEESIKIVDQVMVDTVTQGGGTFGFGSGVKVPSIILDEAGVALSHVDAQPMTVMKPTRGPGAANILLGETMPSDRVEISKMSMEVQARYSSILRAKGYPTTQQNIADLYNYDRQVLKRLDQITSHLKQYAPHAKLDTTSDKGNEDLGYGKRIDGTNKGAGFFGEIPTRSSAHDETYMTELSASATHNGKTVVYPLIVPTLTYEELEALQDGETPESVDKKAFTHYLQRVTAGKSPFAGLGEQRPVPQKAKRSLSKDIYEGLPPVNLPITPRSDEG